MPRFLVSWHINLAAPWPTDASKYLESMEKMWAALDGSMKKGEIEEFGVFPDGLSGYAIGKGETVDAYRGIITFHPYMTAEVNEIIPYEKSKEVVRALCKARIAAAKK